MRGATSQTAAQLTSFTSVPRRVPLTLSGRVTHGVATVSPASRRLLASTAANGAAASPAKAASGATGWMKKLVSRGGSDAAASRPAQLRKQQEPQPPQPLPDPPTRSRALLLNAGIWAYLVPLYRRGWSYRYEAVKDHAAPVPVLRKVFELKDDGRVLEFVGELGRYMKDEKHHALVTFSANRVEVITYTHSGYILHTPEETNARPAASSSRTAEASEKVNRPGVTARDVHLAYFAEQLFERQLNTPGAPVAVDHVPYVERPLYHNNLEEWRAVLVAAWNGNQVAVRRAAVSRSWVKNPSAKADTAA